MQATGMVPGMGEAGEEGDEGAAGVTSAGGPNVNSGGGGAAATPPGAGGIAGGTAGGGMLPDQLYKELITKAWGTKMAQRRAPESDQSD
jgi:hypothetical protein